MATSSPQPGHPGNDRQAPEPVRWSARPPDLAWALPALAAATTALWSGTLDGGTAVTAQIATAAIAILLVVVGVPRAGAAALADPLGLLAGRGDHAASVEQRRGLYAGVRSGLGRGWGSGRASAWIAGWVPPLALWLVVLVSTWLSPVSRAGLAPAVALPLYLLLPLGVAGCLASPAARRRGLTALAGVVVLVAGWALADWGLALVTQPPDPLFGAPRAARPLGHHNLLTCWLVALAPCVLPLLAREESAPPRNAALPRLALLALGLATLAVVASRSLSGAVGAAAAVGAWIALRTRGRGRAAGAAGPRPVPHPYRVRRAGPAPATIALGLLFVLAVVAILSVGGFASRLQAIANAADNSVAARLVYLQGAWEGFLARPIFGWGAGSTPWLAAAFLAPRAGVNPPGELVGDWHAWPLGVLFELGSIGVLLVGALLALLLCRAWRQAQDPTTAACAGAAGAGLCGVLVAGLGGLPLAIGALPVALLLPLGLLRTTATRPGDDPSAHVDPSSDQGRPAAAGDPEPGPAPGPEPEPNPGPSATAEQRTGRHAARWLAAAAVVLLVAGQARPWLAGWQAERAITAPREAAVDHLQSARRLDPNFPLYAARLALLATDPASRRAAARAATAGAPGVAPFALLAAAVLAETGDDDAGLAAARLAAELDPLSGVAPVLVVLIAPDAPDAVAALARALAGEPRLLAATAWESRPALLAQAIAHLVADPSLDAGWRAHLAELAPRLLASPSSGSTQALRVILDGADDTAASRHLFRRQRHPLVLLQVALEPGRLGPISRLAAAPPAAETEKSRPSAAVERAK